MVAPNSLVPPASSGALAARVNDELAAHPSGDALAALAFELMSRQAEARLLFSGKEYVERKASERKLAQNDAKTSAGNLLSVLERGAENDAERALLAVAMVRGLSAALGAAEGDAREAILSRFVRHADYLEVSTPLSIFGVVSVALDAELRPLLHAELAQRIVDDGSGDRGRAHAMRARNAARLSALASWADEPSASRALSDVRQTRALDSATAALAASLAPGASPSSERREVKGLLERPRTRSVWRALSLISGVALLGWALRGLLALVGARREVDLRIVDAGIELEERTRAFGRILRQTKSAFTFAGVRSVAREVRYPRLHLYAGAIALGLGVLVGGIWIFDGVRGGDFRLAALGAGLLLAGALLDLVLDVIVPAQRGRVSVELAADRGRRVRVGNLPLAEADAFVGALRQRMR